MEKNRGTTHWQEQEHRNMKQSKQNLTLEVHHGLVMAKLDEMDEKNQKRLSEMDEKNQKRLSEMDEKNQKRFSAIDSSLTDLRENVNLIAQHLEIKKGNK